MRHEKLHCLFTFTEVVMDNYHIPGIFRIGQRLYTCSAIVCNF